MQGPGNSSLPKEFCLPRAGLALLSGLMSSCETRLNNYIFFLSIAGPDFAAFEKPLQAATCRVMQTSDEQSAMKVQ